MQDVKKKNLSARHPFSRRQGDAFQQNKRSKTEKEKCGIEEIGTPAGEGGRGISRVLRQEVPGDKLQQVGGHRAQTRTGHRNGKHRIPSMSEHPRRDLDNWQRALGVGLLISP